MRVFIAAAAIAALFCAVPDSAVADTTAVKRFIKRYYYKELPATIMQLPWAEFKTYLDKYTDILTPAELQRVTDGMRGVSSGRIGITKQRHRMGWEVVRVVPESPAYWAGLLPGDVMVASNDTSLVWADVMNMGTIVRGPAGTHVVLDVLRDGVCHRIAVQRADLQEDAIFCTVFGRTLAVRILQFDEGIAERFTTLTSGIDPLTIDTVLFDLRDNPGGRVDATLSLLSQFVPADDTLLAIAEQHDTEYEFSAGIGRWRDERTYIILQNEESASASELFAGTMAVRCSAMVVGKTSYGKGRIQRVFTAADVLETADTAIGGFSITSALYLAGGTLAVDGVGVKPHVEMDLPQTVADRLPDSVDVTRLRMDVAFPTQRHIDSVNGLGHGAIAALIWTDRATPFEAYHTLTSIRHQLPKPVWACTADHDSVHTAYARKEEEAIRRLLAEVYAGQVSDSILRMEPVERLLEHVHDRVAMVRFDKRDEREDLTKPHADDLGLALDTIDGMVYVTGVYPKSTAYEAGICIGDRITSVNGKLLATGIDWARRDIRRAARRGGTVDLMVRRGNVIKRVTCSARPRDVGVPLTYVRDGVGIIAVERFGASHHAATQLTRVIERLMRDETHSIVIDLRGSYGGSMDPTLRVLELFARKGDTLARVWKHGRIQRAVIAKAHGSLRRVPVFICIDTATSGAAELFAQSMQQNRYATIVGLMSKGAMYEAEERHLTGTIGMRYVLWQFGRTVDARIQPDVLTVLPVDNVLRIRDAAAGLGDIRSWRQTTAGPDDGVIMDVGRSRPHVIRASDAETIAAVIYGNAARLYNLMSAMQPILLSTSPITKR